MSKASKKVAQAPPSGPLRLTGGPVPDAAGPGGVADLPELLTRASVIINKMLETLRTGQQALQRRAVEKLHHTNAKLHEVNSATESAATDIMDGLDRAFLLIDELEGDGVSPRGAEIGAKLRDELFGVMTHLQFQDITSQQLNHASSIIQDMETHLDEFAAMFDLQTIGKVSEPDPARHERLTFDPCATTRDAERRQALVDELLTVAER